tara:strand:+ start:4715 stop:5062 length:348 start_codon:yes stop_codon:yes gene_type:complete
MADVTILFTGYNSITQTYNTGGYNEDVAFPALTSALGSVTSTGDTTVTVTGVSADATAGNTSESAGGGISVGVTGLSLTGSIGSTNVWGPVSPGIDTSWTPVDTSQTPNWTEVAA